MSALPFVSTRLYFAEENDGESDEGETGLRLEEQAALQALDRLAARIR